MIQKLHRADLDGFLRQTPFAVIHLDAEWDGYRFAVAHQIEQIQSDFAGVASFGYMDVDDEPDFAREIGLRNTPACAYYKDGELQAVVIGMGQNVGENIRLMQGGHVPDMSNWMSRF
jgi:thioredoxin-like negative regulator of GroEL